MTGTARVEWTPREMLTVVGSRHVWNGMSCFVGIGLPSTVVNLARLTHAPDVILIYESGTLGSKPTGLPLSIGDGELAETADSVVSVPEVFNYWLQGGRVDMGYLAAAQIDRWGNLNSTVIGDYATPRVRLPGAGGAPEISAFCGQVTVIMPHNTRSFVSEVDFITTFGIGKTSEARRDLGMTGMGPQTVITDLGILRVDSTHRELTLTAIYPGVTVDEIVARTEWPLLIADKLEEVLPPTGEELSALRSLTTPV